MMAVVSRDPDTITLYTGLTVRQVTASVWPYRHCLILSCLQAYSHTVTTWGYMELKVETLPCSSFLCRYILFRNFYIYNFTCYFTWVWNLVCHCKMRT
jgi:hypothetical protein